MRKYEVRKEGNGKGGGEQNVKEVLLIYLPCSLYGQTFKAIGTK